MLERWPTRPPRGDLAGYLSAIGIVAACTAVADVLFRMLHTERLSPVFLAAVLITAVNFGPGPAYFSAFLAFGVYNYYLAHPRFMLTFASAEDVLLLIIFMAVAVLTGRLAGRVRDQAAIAQARARTADALFEASRGFSALTDEAPIRGELLKHVGQAAHGPAAMWDGQHCVVWPPGAETPPRVRTALEGPTEGQTVNGWRLRPISAQQEDLGRIGWRESAPRSAGAESALLIDVLVDVGAAAIIRARLAAAQAETRAFAETERLRNALLSSISHDLRTPLAAILASVTSLRDFGNKFPDATRDDLHATIQEEAERLNDFVANLLQMTRLEGGAVGVRATRVDVREVFERAAKRLRRRAGRRRLRIAVAGDLAVQADPMLVEQVLVNLLENAVRFSPDGTEIVLSGAALDGSTLLEVTDEGPGVPEADLTRIFEKFYRAPTSPPNQQGTGLGLSIVKGLVEAMDGRVIAGRAPEGNGLRIRVLLPSGGA